MQELKLFEGGHFTVSEQGQLKNQLSRWAALTDAQVPEFNKDLLPKGKDVFTLAKPTTQ
jgi:hypothetical protein